MTHMTGYSANYADAGADVSDRYSIAFGLAVLTSLAIHGAVVLMMPGENSQGVAYSGHGGITVSLGPAGRDAGGETAAEHESFEAVQETVVAEVEAFEASETLETVSAEPVLTETLSVIPEPETPTVTEATDREEVEEAEPETPESEAIEVDAVEFVEAEIAPLETPIVKPADEIIVARKVAAPPLPRRRPEQIKTPSAEAPPKAKIAAKPPEPVHREARESATEQTVTALKPARAEAVDGDATTLTTNQIAGQGGRSGESGLSEVGQGDNSAGGGTPGADSDYYREVLAWLEKHKRYPRRSKLRNEQGVVLLRFVVSRDGMVTISKIKKSSGHKRLDKEAMGMIERAQPLPAIPDGMRQAKLSLVVPVEFHLQ